ncbi:MAG TPA: hypothetical protein VMU89_16540 [Thermomicrobiaceae bacterium]|nr:hypothetical protein [Thermomicrobiaceae bacterium]
MGRSNRHRPTRRTTLAGRCRRRNARLSRPELLKRYTRPLPVDKLPTYRSDFAIGCPLSQDWLLANSRRLVRSAGPRWAS